MRFRTGWRKGFLSRREFCGLYNWWSELSPLIFREQLSRCRYYSQRDFHPVRYTATVNTYCKLHAGYTSTRSNLTDSLNALRCIQPCIWHCYHSHPRQRSPKPAYPHPLSRSPRNHYQSTANASYRKESEIVVAAIATTGRVYTSISGLRQSQHLSIWPLRHDASCICNGQTPRALDVEQMGIYECKQLGDGKLCNTAHCKSISWSPTLVDDTDILKHRNAAKQYLVHSIWAMNKGDLKRGMLKQWPTVDITCSTRYWVFAQVDKVKSQFIQCARDNIAELYDLHCFESDAERLEFIDSLLADNQYLFPVAGRVEGGVCSPNPMQSVSKAANEWPATTLLPGGNIPAVYLH